MYSQDEQRRTLLVLLWVDDIFIERRSALETGESHNLGEAILLGRVEFFRSAHLLQAHRLDCFASSSCPSTCAGGFQSSHSTVCGPIALELGQRVHQMAHQLA